MFIDLDEFKCINDAHGHDAGDALLIEVARRMQSITRQEDLVFRLGGDEFMVLIHQINDNKEIADNKAIKLAEKYSQLLKEPFHFDKKVLQINSSIGIRILDGKKQKVTDLIKEADCAMYQAKHQGGGNIVLFDEQLSCANENNSAAYLNAAPEVLLHCQLYR
jgi:diguanylate cyclase (GGDEF)-like protein